MADHKRGEYFITYEDDHIKANLPLTPKLNKLKLDYNVANESQKCQSYIKYHGKQT